MLLGAAVDLGPGHIMLDGDPAPPVRKGYSSPLSFRPMSIVAKRSPISATADQFLEYIKDTFMLQVNITRRAFPVLLYTFTAVLPLAAHATL